MPALQKRAEIDSLPFRMSLLRILSINLLVDRAVPSDLHRVVTNADPDVVCTQEMGPRTAEVVARILPHGRLDPRSDLFGMGIAARHPVTVEQLGLEGRSGWVARLKPDAWPDLVEPFDVYDVHLTNPVDRPWRVARAQRRRQIDRIGEVVDERATASVVIGDMNASPLWPEYKRLSEIGADAARATGTARRTWSQFLAGPRLLRIDHAFVTGAQPIATATVKVGGTDHCALVVDVEF